MEGYSPLKTLRGPLFYIYLASVLHHHCFLWFGGGVGTKTKKWEQQEKKIHHFCYNPLKVFITHKYVILSEALTVRNLFNLRKIMKKNLNIFNISPLAILRSLHVFYLNISVEIKYILMLLLKKQQQQPSSQTILV